MSQELRNSTSIAAGLIEKAETAILGGMPQALVAVGNKTCPKPDYDEPEAILASAECLIGIGSAEDYQQSDHRLSANALLTLGECAVLRCQLAGIKGDYESVLKSSDTALWALEAMDKAVVDDGSRETSKKKQEVLTASALGYRGYAFTRLGRYRDALPLLERSIDLRQQMGNIHKSGATFAQRRERREMLAMTQALNSCYKSLGVQPPPPPVIKFPRTAHLFDTGGTATSPDDLVVSDKAALLSTVCDGTTQVVIEEKIDGANLGFSLCPVSGKVLVQNRSHYISSADHAQYNRITEWVAEHQNALTQVLTPTKSNRGEKRILYGEWVVAKHSIPYNKLPGYFIAFDIYEQTTTKFFSRARFHTTMKDTDIPVVPVITTKTFGPYAGAKGMDDFYNTLRSMLNCHSTFRDDDGFVEGIVLRVDEQNSTGTSPLWMEHRWKVVRPDFVRGCQGGHWSSRKIEKQRVDYEFAQRYLSECYSFAESDVAFEPSVQNSSLLQNNVGKKAHVCETPPSNQSTPKKKTTAGKRQQREFQAQLARARRRVPRCIMLMGLPASGKSTFASKLAKGSSGQTPQNKWTVVNQDSMGRKECVATAGRVSRFNRIILDRCNLTEDERSEWLGILHRPSPGEVALVYFAAPADTCVERAMNRVGHETIPHGRGERIIRGLAKRVEEPTEKERRSIFGTMEVLRTFQESDALLQRWGVLPPS